MKQYEIDNTKKFIPDDVLFTCLEASLFPRPYIKKSIEELMFYKGKIGRYKVIANDPAVILIDRFTGKKYISKAHDEPFDIEKGILMCLAKANGTTHLDLKRMIKSVDIQKMPHSKGTEKIKKTTDKTKTNNKK